MKEFSFRKALGRLHTNIARAAFSSILSKSGRLEDIYETKIFEAK